MGSCKCWKNLVHYNKVLFLVTAYSDGFYFYLCNIFSFPNNGTNSCHLLTHLIVDGLVVQYNRLQIYLVSDALWQTLDLAHGEGEAGVLQTNFVDTYQVKTIYAVLYTLSDSSFLGWIVPMRGSVHQGQVASPSQEHVGRNETKNHSHSHTRLGTI